MVVSQDEYPAHTTIQYPADELRELKKCIKNFYGFMKLASDRTGVSRVTIDKIRHTGKAQKGKIDLLRAFVKEFLQQANAA